MAFTLYCLMSSNENQCFCKKTAIFKYKFTLVKDWTLTGNIKKFKCFKNSIEIYLIQRKETNCFSRRKENIQVDPLSKQENYTTHVEYSHLNKSTNIIIINSELWLQHFKHRILVIFYIVSSKVSCNPIHRSILHRI